MGEAPAEDIVAFLHRWATDCRTTSRQTATKREDGLVQQCLCDAARFDEAAAEIEALRTALARVEGEKNDWMQRAAKGAESFNAALSDCRILLAECEAIRADFAECGATASERWRAAMAATDASGARTRHATKGGGA